MSIVRVGEGHYNPMNKIPPEHRQAVDRILRDIRRVTSKVTINGQEGDREEMTSATEGMTDYTRWWIIHPWHVTGTKESGKVPPDCDCDTCTKNCEGREDVT